MLEEMFTTTEENEATLSLFCELGISSQDQFCLYIKVNMEKRGRQIFSKIVRASKLTRQRTLQIYKQRSPRSQTLLIALKKRQKNSLDHGELTETNKALRFFLEGIVISTSDVFFKTIDAKALKKIKTMICHVGRYYKDLTFAHLLFTVSCVHA